MPQVPVWYRNVLLRVVSICMQKVPCRHTLFDWINDNKAMQEAASAPAAPKVRVQCDQLVLRNHGAGELYVANYVRS